MRRPLRAHVSITLAIAALVSLASFAEPLSTVAAVPVVLRETAPDATAPAAARDEILRQYKADGLDPIGPGVTHSWGRMITRSGQQVINVVEVKPAAAGLSIEARLANDRVVGLETPTSTANRASVNGHFAIAAING